MITEIIAESLEMLSGADFDLYDKVYEEFFCKNPKAEELMAHMDELTRGRMMSEVTRLFLVDDLEAESAYIKFEYANHKNGYNVASNMYRELFDSFLIAAKEIAGESWRLEFDYVWRYRADELERAFNSD